MNEMCRRSVNDLAPGSPCPSCRHTSLVHPHVGNPGVAYCGLCELQVAISARSTAPRPLYVNHDRTVPVAGDVARPIDGTRSTAFYMYGHTGTGPARLGWFWPNGTTAHPGNNGLRLLVDGETGQVVP